MNEFKTTEVRTLPPEVRLGKEISWLGDLLAARKQKARIAARYLRRFGGRLSPERAALLGGHLRRTQESVGAMREELQGLCDRLHELCAACKGGCSCGGICSCGDTGGAGCSCGCGSGVGDCKEGCSCGVSGHENRCGEGVR